ncbi:uncharacterized protein JCM10292_001798 [Rhodotorula paludigena]|uniref:uncharacterized protein n=1 Tax=Rhodotorula paludigena TaxID=86838 RepID=UPI00316E00CF
MKTLSALIPLAALLLVAPHAALATPPPELQDALSAAAAATVALPIPSGVQTRMLRRDKKATRKGEEADEAYVVLPGSGEGKKVDGAAGRPIKKLPDSFRSLDHAHKRRSVSNVVEKKRNFIDDVEDKLGLGSTRTAELARESGKVTGDDRRYYWYVEDSDDQKHWREKEQEHKDKKEREHKDDKRDVGDFFEDIVDEVNGESTTAAGASKTAGFVTSTRAPSSAATGTAASSAATTSASTNGTEATWNPATWPGAVSSEISEEYDELKDKINNLSALSKVGLAALVISSTLLFFALLYCTCKLCLRRRRRNAAERAQASLAANRPGGRGRSFDERATAIPMMGFAAGSTVQGQAQATGKDAKGKGKRRSSWSLTGRHD